MNPYLKKFVESTFDAPGSALDLGAGDMTDVRAMRKMGWNCFGVDMLTGVDLELLYVDSNRPFDLVYSNYVWHKLQNKKTLLQTAYGNLKEKGWLFLHTFGDKNETSPSPFGEEYAGELLKKSGFHVVYMKQFPLYEEEHKHTHHILEIHAQRIERLTLRSSPPI